LFTNLLVFFLFFALFLGGIWLVVRSVRSQNQLRKIVGILAGGLLTLLFGAVVFFGGKGLWTMYVPVGEVPDLNVEGTPEQIARGEYLAFISCNGCHGLEGQRDQPLAGGLDLSTDIPLPIGSMIASNITPGGILKERSDGELFRVLRSGYNGDNQLSPTMNFLPYRYLSDEDLFALIAYMRSLEPIESTGNYGSQLNFLAAVLSGAGMFPTQEIIHGAVTAPPRGETPEYGKYVATFGDCRTCHGPDMTGTPPSVVAPAGYPNARPMVATWTLDQFIQTMRTGVRPTGLALDMPWENASYMDDQDLAALFTYLTTEP
jgi:mono/diheme cytochrome c family protein